MKLADLQVERGGSLLEEGSIGLLRWHDPGEHTFKVLKDRWLREVPAF